MNTLFSLTLKKCSNVISSLICEYILHCFLKVWQEKWSTVRNIWFVTDDLTSANASFFPIFPLFLLLFACFSVIINCLALIRSQWWVPLILYLFLLLQHQETVQQFLWFWILADLAFLVLSLHLNSGRSQQTQFTEASLVLIEFWPTSEYIILLWESKTISDCVACYFELYLFSDFFDIALNVREASGLIFQNH